MSFSGLRIDLSVPSTRVIDGTHRHLTVYGPARVFAPVAKPSAPAAIITTRARFSAKALHLDPVAAASSEPQQDSAVSMHR